MKKHHLWLIGIILISLLLRVIALNQSLWLDEGIEWWGVTSFGLKKLLTGYMVGDFNPPGHHLLLWFWVRVFGDSEIALRMPSVFFGIGTVVLAYLIAMGLRKKKDEDFPAFAALLCAANGLLIYYSQEARMYAMATFFVTASVWAFLKLQEKYSPKLFVVFCLLFAAALYSHYLVWFMIPVFFIAGVRKVGIARSIAPVIATVPLWPLLVKQLQAGIASAGNSQWAMLSQTTPKNVALVFVKFVTGRIPFPHEPVLQILVGGIVLAFWIRVLRGGIKALRDQKLIIVAWAMVPLAFGGLIGLVIPIFSYFRFLFVLPAVILLFSLGLRSRVTKSLWAAVFLLFSLLYLLNPLNHREDWRGAVAGIYAQSKTSIVLIHPAVRPPFDYYDHGRSTVVYFADVSKLAEAETSNQIWNIPYGQPIFDPGDTTRAELKRLDFSRSFEQHFQGVTIEEWERLRIPDRPKFLKL